MFRSRAERKVADAGFDPKRLPPGQYLTDKWPVLHAGAVPQTEITIDIHCVTRWSRFDASFGGVHWRELAKLAVPLPEARYVVAHAEQDFTANIPLEALEDDRALIAWGADGEPLSPDHGWPLRLVIPSRYFWKSAKWLRGLELLPQDRPGFWERYGYHNDANPWREERYGF